MYSASAFSILKRGHSRIHRINKSADGRDAVYGCIKCRQFDPRTCVQTSAPTTGEKENFSQLRKAKGEGFVGGETRIVRGSAVILPFVKNERVRIEIPALNLKFGARREYPQGYTGTLVGRDPYGRNFLVKLEKEWKKTREETIKEIWTPGALLARAARA